MKKIDMAGPDITQHEIDTVLDAMKNGWHDNPYYYVEKFQNEFAKYHGRKFGIMTPSCTTAIHLLLTCLGVGEGDEVIVPECTWIASAAPITYLGAKPVFCDIEKTSWCLDPESVEKNITSRTKAIIAVDVFGNMPNMDRLREISERNNIHLVEDAAEALGSKYRGKRAGKFGIGSVFSFHRTKTLTTGEGGMILLDDKELYKKCMIWRDHGRDGALPAEMRDKTQKMYFNKLVTYKYMPCNLLAALGYAQFERVEELVSKKRNHLKLYSEFLSDVPDISFNQDDDIVYNGAWITTAVIGKSHNKTKEYIISEMQKEGITIRPFFYPLSMLPAYNISENRDLNPTSYDISSRGINLPGSALLETQDIELVSTKIKKVLLG